MKLLGSCLLLLSVLALGAQADPITLGTASTFGVLAGSGVTNASAGTVINGDVGSAPTPAVTGLTPDMVNGTLYLAADAATAQAQTDLLAAYNAAAGATSLTTLTGVNLGGLVLTPGVYTFASSADLTGTLTLDGLGDPNAQFIFQIGSTLTTATGSDVLLINGVTANNVFFQVGSSATIGAGSTFSGVILANTSITLDGGVLNGQALALNGAVTITGEQLINVPEASEVPEPATMFLLGTGLAGVAAKVRRRKASQRSG